MKHEMVYIAGPDPYMEKCKNCGKVYVEDQVHSLNDECEAKNGKG